MAISHQAQGARKTWTRYKLRQFHILCMSMWMRWLGLVLGLGAQCCSFRFSKLLTVNKILVQSQNTYHKNKTSKQTQNLRTFNSVSVIDVLLAWLGQRCTRHTATCPLACRRLWLLGGRLSRYGLFSSMSPKPRCLPISLSNTFLFFCSINVRAGTLLD